MYDVIVVGGGHAGCEAALSPAVRKMKTCLVTGNLSMVGSMPCNPSIGGPAKGVVVREIDALGGYMGKNADLTQIQVKILNSSKGPAVRALRFQQDKHEYMKQMLIHLKNQENLDLVEAMVEKVFIEDGQAKGVILASGEVIYGKSVIVTTGTFLNSRILKGHESLVSGPDNQETSFGLSKQLESLGFEIQRLKTGTPARVVTKSIDFSQVSREDGSLDDLHYSFDPGYKSLMKANIPCYLTYTNSEIHELINNNLGESAMYGGVIKGIGPRYCPSIETKIVRFSDKPRHQIFFEPEGIDDPNTYIAGFSTSMPEDIQLEMLQLIPGLKNCEVAVYSYSIEYDAINPLHLKPTLETHIIENLYTAGQINGTSGYEEAACQGLMASINAVNKIKGLPPFILRRDEAYTGVLIDDLVTKGTSEPYRLLTSRAEYRLLLRHDNADLRLREYGYKYGLISEKQHETLKNKIRLIKETVSYLETLKISPKDSSDFLERLGSKALSEGTTALKLLKRPEVNYKNLGEFLGLSVEAEILEQVEIETKYEGYIKKSLLNAKKLIREEERFIPEDLNYDDITNIALEAKEKFKLIKPRTIGQASRISGVNPSDIAVLAVYIESKR